MSSDSIADVPGLEELLDRCRQRVRVQVALRGAAEIVCVLMAGMLISCLADYVISLPGIIRFGLLSGTTVLTGFIIIQRLVRPMFETTPLDELGAAVDLEFPQLQESVATLLSVRGLPVAPNDVGSRLMRERLATEVQSQIMHVQPAVVVKSRSTIRRIGLALASFIAILIPVLVWPSGTRLLVQRFVLPFSNLESAANLYFEVPEGSRVVARNSNVRFFAVPHWRTAIPGDRPADVVLEMRTEDENSGELELRFEESEHGYVGTLLNASESFRFRVRGGGVKSAWFEILVRDPPIIQEAVMTAIPPHYTRRPPETFLGVSGDLRVFEGSQIETSVTFNEPVNGLHIHWDKWQPIRDSGNRETRPAINPPVEPVEFSTDRRKGVFRFEALGGGDFDFVATGDHGLLNSQNSVRRLILVPDTPPQLTAAGVHDGMSVRPDDILQIECTATDDIGLGLLEMHYEVNVAAEGPLEVAGGGNVLPTPVPSRPAAGRKEVSIVSASPFTPGALSADHKFELDIKSLGLKSGDWLVIRVCAADQRPEPEPHTVWQGPWTIVVDESATPLDPRSSSEADRKLAEELRRLQEQLARDAAAAAQLKNDIDRAQDEQTREAARNLAAQEERLADELKELAENADDQELTPEQEQKLKGLAQQIGEDAGKKMEEAAEETSEIAAQKMEEAAEQLGKARDELERITDDIGSRDSPRDSGNMSQFDGQIPDPSDRAGKRRLWGRLQDELNSDNGDSGKEVLDNEYSDLIRRYRRDLARTADQASGVKP